MIDTITGTPMGIVRTSAGGSGKSIRSNRYVLQHTYTIQNTTADTIDHLQLFQLLHGLNSQSGVYDNRTYSGPYSQYRYDTLLRGTDATAAGTGSSADGLEDFIAFHSKVAPTALEIGHYGIDPIDNHGTGKPSDGVHLSVESNWQGAPYNARQGTDSFAPANLWVGGAQRWDLPTLAPGASTSFDVLLSILTGTKADATTTGGCANGGSSEVGGVDFSFPSIDTPGSLFAEFSRADQDEIDAHVAEGEFTAPNFPLAGDRLQMWDLDFSGSFGDGVHLVFGYDPALLSGLDENDLDMFHFNGDAWVALHGTSNPLTHTIAVDVNSLSPFALGAVPEPASLGLLAGALLLLLRRPRPHATPVGRVADAARPA